MLLFVIKVYKNVFLPSLHTLFHMYLLNSFIALLINHFTQGRQTQIVTATCDQVCLQSIVWFISYEMI